MLIFSMQNLREANLTGMSAIAANFSRADLSRALLHRSNFQEANLRQVNLSESDLQLSHLEEIDAIAAYCHRTNLKQGHCPRRSFP